MIEKVRKSFNGGVASLRWFAQFLAERSKAETSIFKIRYECSRLQSRKEELYKDLGKRVLELKEKEDNEVFKDFIVQQSMDEIRTLRKEIEGYNEKEEAEDKAPE